MKYGAGKICRALMMLVDTFESFIPHFIAIASRTIQFSTIINFVAHRQPYCNIVFWIKCLGKTNYRMKKCLKRYDF
jgi:hypothetical protein